MLGSIFLFLFCHDQEFMALMSYLLACKLVFTIFVSHFSIAIKTVADLVATKQQFEILIYHTESFCGTVYLTKRYDCSVLGKFQSYFMKDNPYCDLL